MALTLRPMDLNLCLPLLTRERWRDAVHGPESHKCSVLPILQGLYIGLE